MLSGLDFLRKFAAKMEKYQTIFGLLLLTLFFISILLQVISRHMLIVLIWTEEMANYSFIWAVFMGASVMVYHRAHFAFNYLRDKLKGRTLYVYNIIIACIVLCFTLPMCYYGVIVVMEFWDYNWLNVPEFKMGYTWMCLPLAGATMSFYTMVQIAENIAALKNGGDVR